MSRRIPSGSLLSAISSLRSRSTNEQSSRNPTEGRADAFHFVQVGSAGADDAAFGIKPGNPYLLDIPRTEAAIKSARTFRRACDSLARPLASRCD